jgi:hypothetical protein
MEQEKQPSVSEGVKKFLKSEVNLEQMAKEYDQAILDAAKYYKVDNIDLIEIKDGKIFIDGLNPEDWQKRDDMSDLPYHRGQR